MFDKAVLKLLTEKKRLKELLILNNPGRDALWIIVIFLVSYVIFSYLDFSDLIINHINIHEDIELDEIVLSLFILPILISIFAARRMIESRKALRELQKAESKYQAIFEAAPVSVILFDPSTHQVLDANDRACQDLGYTHQEMLNLRISDFDALADAPAIRQRGRQHVQTAGTQEFEAQHRTKSGDIRDVLVRVRGVRIGKEDLSFGAQIDITERRKVEASRQMLAREIDHRSKNILAIVQAVLRLSPKNNPEAYARSVEQRVMALSRAHGLLADGQWEGVCLRQMLKGELSSFLAGNAEPQATLSGPFVMLPAVLTQPISMVVHELITNAIKYGGLSQAAGRLSIDWSIEDNALHMVWTEKGGPAILGPPLQKSFGTRLIELTTRSQMRGVSEWIWKPEGLSFRMKIPLPFAQNVVPLPKGANSPHSKTQEAPLLKKSCEFIDECGLKRA